MTAARRFILGCSGRSITRLGVELFGSLGATGKGHGTDRAIILGFLGEEPDSVDPDRIPSLLDEVSAKKVIALPEELGTTVFFDPTEDIVFNRRKSLSYHSNGIRFTAAGSDGKILVERTFYSIGGGFILEEDELASDDFAPSYVPYEFSSGKVLLELCAESGLSISQLMLYNEISVVPEAEFRRRLLEVWVAMRACVQRGCDTEGILPGGLNVRHRAPSLHRKLSAKAPNVVGADDPMIALDWINLWALAVNEKNADGGRVVTARTNGAAGIIPAVLHYATEIVAGASDAKIVRFLLIAAAIGSLYKKNASISGADVGCQGEVGVACSMAVAALAEYLGLSPLRSKMRRKSEWSTTWGLPVIRSVD